MDPTTAILLALGLAFAAKPGSAVPAEALAGGPVTVPDATPGKAVGMEPSAQGSPGVAPLTGSAHALAVAQGCLIGGAAGGYTGAKVGLIFGPKGAVAGAGIGAVVGCGFGGWAAW